MAADNVVFVTTVEEFRPNPDVPQLYAPTGHMLPGGCIDKNVIVVYGPHSGQKFCLKEGQRCLDVYTDSGEKLSGGEPYQVTSLFHHRGSIYHVEASATDKAIGCECEDKSCKPLHHDTGWTLPHFEHDDDNRSIIQFAGRETRLHHSAHGSRFANVLLTSGSQAPSRAPDGTRTVSHAAPSLGGRFATRLGLVAMSRSPYGLDVFDALRAIDFEHGWNVNAKAVLGNSNGWLDPRGVIVKIYVTDTAEARHRFHEFERRCLIYDTNP